MGLNTAVNPLDRIEAEVVRQEERFIQSMLHDMRTLSRDHREVELKIAMVLDRETGQPEIIFAGFMVKKSIEPLRKTYRFRKEHAR